MRQMQLDNERGVTITELMIILVIMAIVAGSALPKLVTSLASLRTRGAREQVVEALRTGRQNAISTTATYRVIFTSTTIQVTCTNGTPAGNSCPANRPPDSTDSVLHAATLLGSPAEMRFDPNGVASTGAGTVSVTLTGGDTWWVCVNIPGRIKVGANNTCS